MFHCLPCHPSHTHFSNSKTKSPVSPQELVHIYGTPNFISSIREIGSQITQPWKLVGLSNHSLPGSHKTKRWFYYGARTFPETIPSGLASMSEQTPGPSFSLIRSQTALFHVPLLEVRLPISLHWRAEGPSIYARDLEQSYGHFPCFWDTDGSWHTINYRKLLRTKKKNGLDKSPRFQRQLGSQTRLTTIQFLHRTTL